MNHKLQFSPVIAVILLAVVFVVGDTALARTQPPSDNESMLLTAKPLGQALKPASPTDASPVVSWDKDQLRPAAAYNIQSDSYLVVWEHVYSLTDHDIYGQRVSADGSLIGEPFGIALSGSSETNPVVTYNPTSHLYLVVWEREVATNTHDIYAQRVTSEGVVTGGSIPIADLPRDGYSPAVTSNSVNGEFFVAFAYDGPDGSALGGRRVASDGSILDYIWGIGRGPWEVAVAFNPLENEYFMVWEKSEPGLSNGHDIRGRRVRNDGWLLGQEVAISTWEYDQVKPRVAFNSDTNEYLIVWEDHHWGWGNDWDIYGQRVDANGTLIGVNFAISWDDQIHRTSPDVVYKSAADEYMVIWEYEYTSDDHDIFRRSIDSDGSLSSTEIPVSNGVSYEGHPVIVSNGGRDYLAVWEDGRDLQSTGMNIYGGTINTCPSDICEPNDTIGSASAIVAGDTQHAFICGKGDEDWFLLTADVGDTLTVDLLDLPVDCDLELYDPAGNQRQRSNATGTAPEQIVYIAESSGQHPIRVYSGGDVFSRDPYALRANIVPSSTPAQLFLSPTAAMPGATIRLRGYGFSAVTEMQLTLNCAPDRAIDLESALTDTDGVLVAQFDLPELPATTCRVDAYTEASARTVSNELAVLPALNLTLSTQEGPPGTRVDFEVRGQGRGQLRLDYAGRVVLGPLATGGGQASGSFMVPSDRPSPLGSPTEVRAIYLRDGSIFGQTSVPFQSQAPLPRPSWTVTDLRLPANVPAGRDFTMTGRVTPAPEGDLSDYEVIPVWMKEDGRIVPIGQSEVTLLPNGEFSGVVRVPSLLAGDPIWPEGNDQTGVILKTPDGSMKVMQSVPDPWLETPLEVRVIDVDTGQPILGAKVGMTLWSASIPAGSLQEVGGSAIVGNWNQVSSTLGTNAPNESGLTADEIAAIQGNLAKCFFDKVFVANETPVKLLGPLPDKVLVQPFVTTMLQQNTVIDNQVGQTGEVQAAGDSSEIDEVLYILAVDALDQGYGEVASDGSVKYFATLVAFNTVDHTYRDLQGNALPKPFDVKLKKLSNNATFSLGPIDFLISGADVITTTITTTKDIPLIGDYYTVNSVPKDVDVRIETEGVASVRISPEQMHRLLAENAKLKLKLDGGKVVEFEWKFDEGVDCGDGSKRPSYRGGVKIPDAAHLAAGIHALEVQVERVLDGQILGSYHYELEVKDVPAKWFSSPSSAPRVLNWWPGKVSMTNPWLDSEISKYELGTTADDTPASGPLVNTTQPDIVFEQTAEANGYKGAKPSGFFTGQSINKPDSKGCWIDECPPASGVAAAREAGSLYTMTFGPRTQDVVPKIDINLPKLVSINFWNVVEVSAGAQLKLGATITYEGKIDIMEDASFEAEARITPKADVLGAMYLSASVLGGIIGEAGVKLSMGAGLSMPVIYSSKSGLDYSGACFNYSCDFDAWWKVGCIPYVGCIYSDSYHENLFKGAKPNGCTIPMCSAFASQQQEPPEPPTGSIYLASNGFGRIMAIYQNTQNSLATSVWDGNAWSPPQVIQTGLGSHTPRLAFLTKDRAIAVWTETNLTEQQLRSIGFENIIKAQYVAWAQWDGTQWSPALPLTRPNSSLGEGGVTLATCPAWKEGCPEDGAAVAVWERNQSANLKDRQIRLYYDLYHNGTWSGQAQPVDPSSTATDILPAVIYRNEVPLIAWVRDTDSDLTNVNSRRIVLRYLNASTVISPDALPSAVAEVTLAVDRDGNPLLAFTQVEDGKTLFSNRRPLTVAKAACTSGGCSWLVNQLTDSFGRTLYAESPQLSVVPDQNGAANGMIVFRGIGYGGEEVEPQVYDAPGMVSGLGELAQVMTDFQSPLVVPTFLTQDGAVNWKPSAVYAPQFDYTLATVVKRAAPTGSKHLNRNKSDQAPAMATLPIDGTLPYEVTTAPSQPDFILLAADVSDQYPSAGQDVHVTARIANAGERWPGSTEDPLEIVAIWEGAPGDDQLAGQTTLTGLQGVHEITLPLTPPKGGWAEHHHLTVTVNPGLTVTEWRSDNNQQSLDLGGVPTPRGLWTEVKPGNPLVFLDWKVDGTENVAGYRIYRAEGGGKFQPIGSSFSVGYVDLNAHVLGTYRYAVSAYGTSGQESELSQEVYVSVPGFHLFLPSARR